MFQSKRYLVVILVLATLFSSVFTTTAIAAEVSTKIIEATPNSTSTPVDNTFIMGSYHRGGDRAYATNKLYVMAIITDVNGNPVDNTVNITLHDYNGNTSIWVVPANGGTYITTFSIVANRMYYFTYNRSGTDRDLKVHMIITPVS